ncbi:hypothetical protein PVK62_07895 [Aliivibrio sp. S3MY1]|uniref:Uncharacterized protein n=1 Tax=Aliivibrio finisterrensis TaxID=511998 RepID=A0ABY0I7C6_9GAMM|nr:MULTISPECIES: hypothetical protein [Aliivibrio]MDD9176029.1 hypothetical protein [Aliivibrio sp. S3TY1]MDD9193057.1 hypothetical protein [Aliivibrio sp. S2TY2]MDD9195760.1 hypothetical protein [Aliivibrio sp. S3MY1]RYU64338.1 hypothetical protein ERW53_10395 [Aliivibrio finisterrensis]RYU83950.1 hypothetical protein ERW52_12235 [Aliivibrio finisterrensis]
MEDIKALIKKEQWLAKDRFDFSEKEGVEEGINIFDNYKFTVCKFTLFENLLTNLDNDSLCLAYDYFEAERLRRCFNDHFNKTKTPINAVEKIVYIYIETLLGERVRRTFTSDIPSIRSEIATYAKMFEHMDSSTLISEFRKSGVQIGS